MTPLTFRTARGLTQQQAADLIGRRKLTWQRWESGEVETPQSVLMLLRYMDALEDICLSIDDLCLYRFKAETMALLKELNLRD